MFRVTLKRLQKAASVWDLAAESKTCSSRILEFSRESVRVFGILAHIDHGKSTLASALLERLGNISRVSEHELDLLSVERDRGITVKAQAATMVAKGNYLFCLMDTPGHVDFSSEVTRSLSFCQGALLLVDASQGVQAQTFAAYDAATDLGVKIIPAITKCDIGHVDKQESALGLASAFDFDPEDVIATSAKTGEGIDELVNAIIERIPSPRNQSLVEDDTQVATARAYLVDMWHDPLRGVVCLLQVMTGTIREGERITIVSCSGSSSSPTPFPVQEVGVLSPSPIRTRVLGPGHVGYIVVGASLKGMASSIRVGDTIVSASSTLGSSLLPPLPINLPPHLRGENGGCEAMMYASVYPSDGGDATSLIKAVNKLALNDGALSYEPEKSTALGSGLRMGFLGVLHMEVFQQRLMEEFGQSALVTAPSVPYTFVPGDGSDCRTILGPANWPTPQELSRHGAHIEEPVVRVSLLTPLAYVGRMTELLIDRCCSSLSSHHTDAEHVLLECRLPWQEFVTGLGEEVKSRSSGYASIAFRRLAEEEPADLSMVEVAVNGATVEALSFVCYRSQAQKRGKKVIDRLKTVIRRQQFEVILQAKINNTSIARARIAPFRKDVLMKSGKMVGGGDKSRKTKLLQKQKRGKARAKTVGRVSISQEAFWSVLQRQ
eukprot:285492_1